MRMKKIFGALIYLFARVKTFIESEEELFGDLNTLENEIKILETKISTTEQLDQLKHYKKEWRYFTNNMDIFLNLKLNETFDQFHPISGFASRHKGLNIYMSKYILFTKKDKLLLVDYSGSVLLEEKFDFEAQAFSIYQEHVRRFPQVKGEKLILCL